MTNTKTTAEKMTTMNPEQATAVIIHIANSLRKVAAMRLKDADRRDRAYEKLRVKVDRIATEIDQLYNAVEDLDVDFLEADDFAKGDVPHYAEVLAEVADVLGASPATLSKICKDYGVQKSPSKGTKRKTFRKAGR